MTKGCFHHCGGWWSFERGTVRKLHAGLGWAKFGEHATHGWGKIALHACSDLSKPVRTCPHLSTIQWPCTLIALCHFLYFRMLLFFGLTSYPAEIAYLNSPNRELSNGVWFMVLYWSKIVDPSRSLCLKTVDRKSFECRNFLVLHPVLVKKCIFQLIQLTAFQCRMAQRARIKRNCRSL